MISLNHITSKSFRFILTFGTVLILEMCPITGYAKRTVRYNYLSAYYGMQTLSGFDPMQRLDLIYSFGNGYWRGVSDNVVNLGLNYAFSDQFKEIGALVNYNVFRKSLFFKKVIFVPVIYGQVGFKQISESQFKHVDFNSRFGFGLDNIYLMNGIYTLRSSAQVGYIVSDTYLPTQSGFTFEVKLGIGIGSGVKRKRRNNENE